LQEQPISSLHDVYRFTGIPKPNLLRILHTLEQAGVVSRRLADGQYRISANQSHLTRKPDRYDRVAEAAAPVLDRLCQKISWPCDLMVPAGDHMEIRESSRVRTPFSTFFMYDRIGTRTGSCRLWAEPTLLIVPKRNEYGSLHCCANPGKRKTALRAI
jgi:IclR family transcriptional regulator, mhp operon transcriptional activator